MSSTRAAYLKGQDRTAAIQQARELYEQGCTIRSVARQMGRSYGGARMLLVEGKVALRGRGSGLPKAGA
jgi:helix-turn-helix protein